MLSLNVIIIVAFDLVWFACAFGASRGSNLPGVIAAFAYVIALLWLRRWASREAALLLSSAFAGIALESLLAATGLVTYEAPLLGPNIAPPWIIALWLAFGATLTPAVALLGSHAAAKAAVLGAIGGPLAYVAGASLGALHIPGSPWLVYMAIAAAWMITYPALISLQSRLSADPTAAPHRNENE